MGRAWLATRMNPVYRETFRRHRALLLLPVVLATAITVWSAVTAPPMYEAAASVWSDSADSTAQAYGAPPPTAQEQSMLMELLTTDSFRTAVAKQAGLDVYLAHNSQQGWGPVALVSKLRGTPSLETMISIALGPKRVRATPQGPHVLKISFDAPTPVLAARTLRVLVAQYVKNRAALRADALTAYRNQVDGASAALTKARAGIASYLLQHPNRADSRSNSQLATMLHSEQSALQQLETATRTLNQESAAVLDSSSVGTMLRVVDPPEVPTAAISGPKKLVKALFAGLFAGALIGVLGLVALTKFRRPAADEQHAAPEADVAAPDEGLRVSHGERRPIVAEPGYRRTGSG